MKSAYSAAMTMLARNLTKLPWETKVFYADYLAQTYYFVSHSTRLLALAASYFDVSKRSLHNRFLQHAREERDHETCAQGDLKQLGYSLDQFPESAYTRALYATQYFNIERRGPESFFGYIVVLEGVAVEVFPRIYSRLESTYGKEACRFLKLHVDEDPDHIEKAFEQMQLLSNEAQGQIREAIAHGAQHYWALLRHAAEERPSKPENALRLEA